MQRKTSQCKRRAEENERIQRNRQFKAQGQARLEELIRDAKLGKKIKQVTLCYCSVTLMSGAWILHSPSSVDDKLDVASTDSGTPLAAPGLCIWPVHSDGIFRAGNVASRGSTPAEIAVAAEQGGKERRFGSDPFDFVPPGVTPQNFMFGDGPLLGPTRG